MNILIYKLHDELFKNWLLLRIHSQLASIKSTAVTKGPTSVETGTTGLIFNDVLV